MKKIINVLYLSIISSLIFSQSFERLSDLDLKGGYLGFASWCDYNSDGYLDVFVTGVDFGGDFTHAELYKNYGDNSFVETNITLIPRVIYGDMSWGDFDNNGTLDLIYAGTTSGFSEDNITKIYKNINDTNLVEITHTLPYLRSCYLEWVDINNDGYLDIYYQGIDSTNEFDLGIYKNNGDETFEKAIININLIEGSRGNFTKNSAKWADFDNDGLKDVIIAMSTRDDFKFELYKNLGDFSFQKINIELPQLNYVNLAVGDINQDGNYDIVFTGSTDDFLSSADMNSDIYIYINEGNFNFDEAFKINNVGVFWNTLELGDINNDGYFDILDYGTGSSFDELQIYINNKDNTFSSLYHDITDSKEGGASLGDFDNDGDLDILYYGRIYYYGDMEVTYIYENKSEIINNNPSPPDSIDIFAINDDIKFYWNKATDDITNSNSLSYNISIGTNSNPNLLLSSFSLNNKLKTINNGNMNTNRNFIYKNMPEGNYVVRVQSIDNSYNTSQFSDTINFCFKKTSYLLGDTLYVCEGDSIQIGINGNYLGYKWNNGSHDSMIFAKDEGLFNVNLIHSDGCISSETVFLKYKKSIKEYLGEDILSCIGDTIKLQVQNLHDINWNNGSENNTININKSGEYWVTGIDSNNCISNDTINIQFKQKSLINLGFDISACEGDTVTLQIQEFKIIAWNNDSINKEINVFNSGKYWVTVMDTNNCISSDTVNVQFNQIPKVNIGADTSIEITDYLILESDSVYSSYLWSTDSYEDYCIIYGPNLSPGDYTYWVQVTDENDCLNSDSITISIYNTTSIINESNLNIKIYPIPFQNDIIIDFNKLLDGKSLVSLYDINGLCIFNGEIYDLYNNYCIPLKKVKRGIYFLNIINYSNNINETFKIIN